MKQESQQLRKKKKEKAKKGQIGISGILLYLADYALLRS